MVKAVNDVELDIRENEIYGIAGESGCGKSTLLKTLAAIVEPPLRQIEGSVNFHVDGKKVDVSTLGREELRKLRWQFISYVPQGSMSVLNPVAKLKSTYYDFIVSHVEGKSQAEAFELAKKHIAELGLPDGIMDAYPHQLIPAGCVNA